MAQKKLLFIVNPRAGRTKSRGPLFDALATLSASGYIISVRKTSCAGNATEIAAQEGSAYDVVVAVGGDGTLNEVISGLSCLEGPHPILGYLPQGSTNDFASSLHISEKPTVAAEAIARGNIQKLDLGLWNQRTFVYVASFGAFTKASYSAPQAAKNALGHFAYLLEGVRDLDTLRPYKIRLTADGEVLDGEYLFGAACNSTSIAGLMKLSPERVILDDGKFEMLLVPNPKNAIELQGLLHALLNQQYDSDGLIFRHVASIQMETDDDIPWSLDGEYAPSETHISIQNCRQALSIFL